MTNLPRPLRVRLFACVSAALLAVQSAAALASQERRAGPEADQPGAPSDGRVVIDILRPPLQAAPPGALDVKECDEEADAAIISEEIVVCRKLGERPGNYYSGSREEWLQKYARETAYINDPQSPDVAGDGIFRGPATVGSLCLLNPCPDPPAILIDVAALPHPPPQSDADRIARGLAPTGDDGELSEQESARRQADLGLPPTPDFTPDLPDLPE